MDSITAGRDFESFRYGVVFAAGDEVSSVEIGIHFIEVDGRAAERCVRRQTLQRLSGKSALSGAQIRNTAHRVRHAADFQSARYVCLGIADLIARFFLQRQRDDEITQIHAVERRIDRSVILANVRHNQRELRAAATRLSQSPFADACLGRR